MKLTSGARKGEIRPMERLQWHPPLEATCGLRLRRKRRCIH
nr:MAG TPA: hypothetical protein [Caudoviricetes sp.]